MYAHDVTVFTNFSFCCLHENDNGMLTKNLLFEAHFQKFAISGPKIKFSCIFMLINCKKP